MSTKVAIIGGGSGGYVAAIRLAQLGASPTLIEKEKMGGTCLNVGCIPTKVLLHYGELLTSYDEGSEFGITYDMSKLNWKKIIDKKSAISNQLVMGINSLMKSNKIEVIKGEATFISKNEISIKQDGKSINRKFDKFIIATGSVPSIPPITGIKDSKNCIDSTAALELESVPKSMAVIGGGVIGVELADMYNSFGTKVTIIEAMPKLLPMMDSQLTLQLVDQLKKKGIDIYSSAKVVEVTDKGNISSVKAEIEGKLQSFEAEKVLVAVGRKPYSDGLGLEKIGVKTDRGRVITDKHMKTSVEGIYAVGDCIGDIMLAHVASAQGEIAAENIMGNNKEYSDKTVASCIYTSPEFAGVGYTEDQLKEKKIPYEVGTFPLLANGKSLIANGGVGMIKILKGVEYKEILGVHILGPRATDLIAEGALAIGMEATVEDIIETIHPHPTVSEALHEAVLASEKICIHMPNKK